MFRDLRLVEAFEHVLSPEEWFWFGPMVARGIYHYGLDGWPVFPLAELQAYAKLWQKAADRVLEKLRAGEWVAKGISPRFGPQPIPISTDLWDYLRFKDRVDEAEGADFRFVALTISDLRPPEVQISQAEQAQLRPQLTEWIRSHAASSSLAILREDQLAAARKAFTGVTTTDNMYRECRRAARLPKETVQRGRPKTKGRDK
jgi:hypothetical protein